MGISAADLAGLRTTIDDFLPDTCTIARTGLTVACRVSEDTREVALPGVPKWMRARRWSLTFPDATDVQPGDLPTVPGKGTYLVTELANPQSYSVSTNAFGLLFLSSGMASTQRPSATAWTSLVTPVTAVTEVATLTLRSFTPQLLTAVNPQVMLDQFGVQAVQPAWVWADTPAAHIERYPVQTGDLVTISTQTYQCCQVQPTPGGLILYLDIPANT